MKIYYYCFYVIILMCFGISDARAQLSVTPSLSAYQLASFIAGQGVSISNATYTGDSMAAGSFTATGTNLGLSSGILLSTGNATEAIGPNSSDAASTEFMLPGDPDLDALTNSPTLDASVLEFDFIPQSDTLTFSYVFASDEYPEYVCSEFNDLFGFFISGPGITGSVNLALIPGTGSPVAINSVNNGSIGSQAGSISADCGLTNSSYFVENDTGTTTIEFDGFTTVLTAKIVITRCLSYHLKMAIADGVDYRINSGVFIEAGSLHSTPIVTAGSDISSCVNLNAAIGGSATAGWNYTWTPSTGLSSTIISNPSVSLTNNSTSAVSYTYTVTADNGTSCILRDTIVLTVNPFPTSDFVVTTYNTCSDDTLQINYVGNSPSGNYTWNFNGATVLSGTGDGPYSLVYPNPGDYTVSLTVAQNACLSAPTAQIVHVKQTPESSFSVPSSVCFNDLLDINYTGNYTSASVIYNWNFGSGTINNGSGVGPYEVTASVSGSSDYSLTVSDSGCSSSSIIPVKVTSLPAASINTIAKPCTGDTVTVNYTGTGASTSLFTWYWDNATLISGSGAGPYLLTWPIATDDSIAVIINDNGCADTTFAKIHTDTKPNAAITVTDKVCTGSDALISFNGFAPNNSMFTWSLYGPASQQGSGAGPITANWIFAGKKPITLTVNNNGCISTTSDTINVIAYPAANISTNSRVCNNDTLNVKYNGLQSANYIYSWNFGNAQTLSGSGAGPFLLSWSNQQKDSVQLIVNNDGCRDTALKFIDIYEYPVAAFNAATTLCEKDLNLIEFTGTSQNGSVFTWNFDSPSSLSGNSPYLVSWNNAGTKHISLHVNNNGCVDTSSIQIDVNSLPEADFFTADICEGLPALFNDTSKVNGSTISNLYWNFGDGQTINNVSSPTHTYQKDSIYPVELIAESAQGCKDTISKSIRIYEKPLAEFSSDTVCNGNATHLKDLSFINSSSIYQWKWNTGDADSSSVKNPQHTFSEGGSYTVSLIVKTTDGCIDTVNHPVRVWALPSMNFTPLLSEGCQPLLINFKNQSSSLDGAITDLKWNFGDNETDSINDPAHIYSEAGDYDVSVTAISGYGCINDTIISNCVKVFPKPEAAFIFESATPDMLIPKVLFLNQSTFTERSHWEFGDGKFSNEENPDHIYRNPGTYPVSLYVTSDEGCKDTIREPVIIKDIYTIYIPNSFTPNDDYVNDVFLVKGYGITSFAMKIFDRWGKEVYNGSVLNTGWDGTLNGKEVPQDTYVYLVKVVDFSFKKYEYSGTVTVIR